MRTRKKVPTHVHDLRQLESEDEVQTRIVEGMRLFGYEMLVTSRRRFLATCPNCAKMFRPKGGDGASKGVSDLIAMHPEWPHYVAMLIEVKGPETKVSPEQQDLADRNRIVICRSLDDAMIAAAKVWEELKKIRDFDAINQRIQSHGGGR